MPNLDTEFVDVSVLVARNDAAPLVARAGQVTVETEEDNQRAAQVARQVKALLLNVDERRKELIRPAREFIEDTNGRFKPIVESLEEAEQHLKGVLHAFVLSERARVGREMAEAESRMARALEEGRVTDAEVEMADMALIPEVSRPPAGSGMTARWKGEVVDMKALCRAILEGALPPEALKPQPAVINGYARDKRVEGTFYGIKVSRDESVSVSGKR